MLTLNQRIPFSRKITAIILIYMSVFCTFIESYKEHQTRIRQSTGYTVENVLKLRCFQCNQPNNCEMGVCYGDICVKSIVNNHYVSKGCENLSISGNVYEPYLKMRHYCKEEEVLGVDTINCYCRDTDFCNHANNWTSIIYINLTIILILLLRL